jgi:hypothetical protein
LIKAEFLPEGPQVDVLRPYLQQRRAGDEPRRVRAVLAAALAGPFSVT